MTPQRSSKGNAGNSAAADCRSLFAVAAAPGVALIVRCSRFAAGAESPVADDVISMAAKRAVALMRALEE